MGKRGQGDAPAGRKVSRLQPFALKSDGWHGSRGVKVAPLLDLQRSLNFCRTGVCRRMASRKNILGNYGAGILDAGQAPARRISEWISNERATPPAAKRTSRNAQDIFSRCPTLQFDFLFGSFF